MLLGTTEQEWHSEIISLYKTFCFFDYSSTPTSLTFILGTRINKEVLTEESVVSKPTKTVRTQQTTDRDGRRRYH